MSSHQRGLEGERLAADHLKRLGLKLIATRYRAAGGEIDLIARDGGQLCFIEVKHRPQARLGEGLSLVDQDKRRRMRAAARAWIKAHPLEKRWRFDSIEITRAGIWYARCAAEDKS